MLGPYHSGLRRGNHYGLKEWFFNSSGKLRSQHLDRLVLKEQLPFGHILKAHDVPHTGRPDAYFRVESDALMNRSFGLEGNQVLYGRRNTLRDLEGRPFSAVVEILPP